MTLMKIIKSIILLTITCISFNTIAISQSNIIGKWLAEDKDAVIEIYKKDNLYYGKIIKLMPATDENGKPFLDENNPDKSKRSNTILGLNTISKMKWNNNILEDGHLYDPRNGEYYNGKIWYENGILKVRGYLGFFYLTQTWTRYI